MPGFHFIEGNERLDWGVLVAIDVQRLAQDTNVEVLQRIVENLAFSRITADEAATFSPSHVIHLFSLAQMVIQYLVYSQECLAKMNVQLNESATELKRDLAVSNEDRVKLREENVVLRKEVKAQRRTMMAYEFTKLHGAPRAQQPTYRGEQPQPQPQPQAGAVVDAMHACPHCGERYHKNESLLSHMRKRHAPKPQSHYTSYPVGGQAPAGPATPPPPYMNDHELRDLREKIGKLERDLERERESNDRLQRDGMLMMLQSALRNGATTPPPAAPATPAAPQPAAPAAPNGPSYPYSVPPAVSNALSVPLVPDYAAYLQYQRTGQQEQYTNALLKRISELEISVRDAMRPARAERPPSAPPTNPADPPPPAPQVLPSELAAAGGPAGATSRADPPLTNTTPSWLVPREPVAPPPSTSTPPAASSVEPQRIATAPGMVAAAPALSPPLATPVQSVYQPPPPDARAQTPPPPPSLPVAVPSAPRPSLEAAVNPDVPTVSSESGVPQPPPRSSTSLTAEELLRKYGRPGPTFTPSPTPAPAPALIAPAPVIAPSLAGPPAQTPAVPSVSAAAPSASRTVLSQAPAPTTVPVQQLPPGPPIPVATPQMPTFHPQTGTAGVAAVLAPLSQVAPPAQLPTPAPSGVPTSTAYIPAPTSYSLEGNTTRLNSHGSTTRPSTSGSSMVSNAPLPSWLHGGGTGTAENTVTLTGGGYSSTASTMNPAQLVTPTIDLYAARLPTSTSNATPLSGGAPAPAVTPRYGPPPPVAATSLAPVPVLSVLHTTPPPLPAPITASGAPSPMAIRRTYSSSSSFDSSSY